MTAKAKELYVFGDLDDREFFGGVDYDSLMVDVKEFASETGDDVTIWKLIPYGIAKVVDSVVVKRV